MPGKLVLSFIDHDGEASAVTVPGLALSAGNIAAQTVLMDDLVAALIAVQEGVAWQDTRVANINRLSGAAIAPEESAQRERKWLVRMTEATDFRKLTFEIPCALMSLLRTGTRRGEMDISTALSPGAVLKAAIEAYYRSDRGYAVTVDEIIHVGRNT